MKKSSFLKNIKKSWVYVKKSKYTLICYALVSIIEGIVGAILPIFTAKIILNITNKIMEQLLYSAILVLIIELLLYTMYFLKGKFYQKIYKNTLVDLQSTVAKETLKLKIKEMDKASSGLFIDRLSKDTEEISAMFMEYTYWLSKIVSNVGIVVAIFVLNKYLFIYTIITAFVIFIINKIRLSKQYKIQRNLKKLKEKQTGLISELVRGIRDIKALNASTSILKQTKNKIIETTKEETKMLDVRRRYNYFENISNGISDYIFIILCIYLYSHKLLTIPTFVIIYYYQDKVKYLLSGVVQILEYNKKFVVSSDRIYEIIENDKFEKEQFGNIEVKKLNGSIKFENVDFQYNDNKKVIDKMSFEITPNQKVAFVGKSGEGKTTIFNLITKMYLTDSGKILLDDYNINDLTCNSIRNNISIITQSPYIFNFSIKENLLLAKEDASMEEIREACKLSCIDDYIMSLPDKYDSMVGENGVVLSGGQKQRLAIARALLKKTEIILFDEATSALDNETQNEIQKAINNLKGEYTILIVAHRLSTVIDCDKIFVVNEGKIFATGSHKKLLENCDYYRNLYEKEL